MNEPFETRAEQNFGLSRLALWCESRPLRNLQESRENVNLREEMRLVYIFLVFWPIFGPILASNVDVGRAKAKISVEEMLKLHRKRRDDDKNLFSINSPRKNDHETTVVS